MSVLFTLIIARQLNWRLCAVLGVISLLGALITVFLLPRKSKLNSFVFLTIAFAFAMFAVRCAFYVEPIQTLNGITSEIVGTVVDEPVFDGERYLYRVRVDKVAESDIADFKTIISSRRDLKLSAFDNLSGTVNFYNDVNDTHRSENVFIRGYVNEYKTKLKISRGKETPYRYAISARRAVRSAISGRLNGDEGALMTSVLIGDKGSMSKSALNSIRVSGISHITVVSGLHLSILTGVMLKFFVSFMRSKRKASAATLLFVVAMMALAGFTPSVVRSGITCTIYLLGTIILKRSRPLHSLCIAALLQCLLNPFVVYSLSFLLSTFSTLGIITLEPKIRRFLYKAPICRFKIARGISSAVALSLSAQILTLPIVITTFGYITPLSVLTNIIVGLPVTGLVCLSAVASLLCISGVFAYLGNFLMLIAGLDGKFILFVSDIMSKPGFSTVRIASLAAYMVIGGICIIFGACLLLPRLYRFRLIAVLMCFVIAVGCCYYAVVENPTVTVTSFVTNKGAAVLIRDGDYAALIGSTAKVYYANNVSAAVNNLGIEKVNLIILPESEMLSGAAPDLLRNLSAEKIIYNDERIDLMKLDGATRSKYTECRIDMTERVSAEINRGYILLSVCGKSIVVPTARTKTPTCDILVSPPEFITTTSSPKYAIISGSTPLALAAGERLSRLGTTSYVVGQTRSLSTYIRGESVSFSPFK